MIHEWFLPFEQQDNFHSDSEFMKFMQNKPYFTLIPINVAQKYQSTEGAFFRWFNNTTLNLKRFQIFRDDLESDYTDNFLIYALQMSGMNTLKLDSAKTYIKSSRITRKALTQLREELEIQVNLTMNKGKQQNIKINIGQSDEIYNLGLIDNHFFINDEIPCTLYVIENYNKICELDTWYNI